MSKVKNILNYPMCDNNSFYIGTKSNDSKIIILSKSTLEKEYNEVMKNILDNENNILNPFEIK